MMPPRPWLALVGPTASGKTEAALAVAELLGCEIVSADSMLVYRGMDIGTAKPTPEQRARVPHHLLDLVEPRTAFSVAAYQQTATTTMEDLGRRGARPLVVGGSGLYVRALVDDLDFPGTDPWTRLDLETEAVAGADRLYERLRFLDPAAAAKIEPGNVRRTVRALEVAAVTGNVFSSYAAAWDEYPPDRVRTAGVSLPREALSRRVEDRVRGMLDAGFLDEVRALVAAGFGGWLTASQAIGYAEMALHLDGRLTLDEAVAGTVKRTNALARRQLAWFRRDPRVRWFEDERGAEALVEEIVEYLQDA